MGKIAIFGGTFNPIHNGHINLCLECQKQYHFDRIILMPTNLPPHKAAPDLAKNEDRFEMCRLASEDYPEFLVSDLEFRLSGVSYSVNTLRVLKKEYANDELYFIIGSDMLYSFHRWYQYQEILRLCHVVAGARYEEEYGKMLQYKAQLGAGSSRLEIIRIPVIEVSSTDVREAIKNGENISRYLSPKVLSYIKGHGLYGLGEE